MTWIFRARNKDLPVFKLTDLQYKSLGEAGAFLPCGISPYTDGLLYMIDPNEVRNRNDKPWVIKSSPAKACAYCVRSCIDQWSAMVKRYRAASRDKRKLIDRKARKINPNAKESFETFMNRLDDDLEVYDRFVYWLGRSSGFEMHRISAETEFVSMMQEVENVLKTPSDIKGGV